MNTTTMVTITAIAIATGLAVPWAAFKPVRSGIVRKLLLRPPATETSHVAGLCLGLPDALHVGQSIIASESYCVTIAFDQFTKCHVL